MHMLLAHAFWHLKDDELDTVNNTKDAGATEPLIESKSNHSLVPPQSPGYNAVPITLIVHVSILVAGIMRAFPSAHQSLHITLYVGNGILDEWPSDFNGRLIGGFVGLLLALIYYHTIYYQANSTSKYNPLKKLVVDCRKENIFMESELTLPAHMKHGRD